MQSLLPEDPKQVGNYTFIGRLGQGSRGIVYLGRLSGEAQVAGQGDPAEAPAPETAQTTGDAGNGKPEAAAQPDEAPPGEQGALQASSEPDRLFAVKLLPPWPEADADARSRVLDDLFAAQRVSSAYTVRTVDAGWTDDRAYIVREHVEGRSLREVVEADGPLTGDVLERTAIGTLTALTAIHLAGLAHRGLTPENVLLGPDGPRVADFGLGETSYLSPEQVRGEPSGPAADVFAWATTIAYAATGSELFGGSAEAIATARPDLGALPLPLRDVVASCLAKAVVERPTAQGAMLWLLGEEKSGPPAPALPVPVGDPDQQTWLGLNGMDGQARPAVVVPHQPEGEGPAPVWAVPPQPQESPKLWGAPELPSEEAEPQARPITAGPASAPAAPPRKKTTHFPIGLAAGVGVVVGLSGLGLWGAGHYVSTQQIGRVAAEGQASGIPAPSGDVGDVGGTGGTTAPRPQVTVPWALSPGPQETGVYPLRLTTPSASAGVPSLSPGPVFTPPPIPSSVPTQTAAPTSSTSASPAPTVTVTQTPVVTPSAETTPSGSPTPGPSGDGSPTPETTPSGTPTPEPSPSASASPSSPSESHSPSPSATAAPTRSATPPPIPRPTVTRTATPKPTVTRTVAPKPWTPVVRPSTAPPKTQASNPYTPQKVCDTAGKGTGFYVQRSSAFSGGVTYQLYSAATGSNCVVTMKTTSIGKASPVSATLEVQGSSPMSDGGSFQYYAGPVIAQAKGKCVKFSGSAGAGSTSVPFANCG
ncbi:serine/threonine protein kinase [Sphaerisporangium sp. NPDC088356]|uniref:protein kinase domain-containing protein n=1 Tax=Sphaerisporangium sp. NPDC088356 TaxID=3154871 RepID=UPI0034243628